MRRSGLRRYARRALFLAGTAALLWVCLYAFGGTERLFKYVGEDTHKLTARALMHGSLKLRGNLLSLGHDEQVYDGAGYGNWGFGVALLQIPFHAIAPFLRAIGSRYFPDRTIFFLYLAPLVPFLWSGVHRMVAANARRSWRRPAAWAFTGSLTLLFLACALFPLLSHRFIVYEETIAYLVVAELYALAAYARALESRRVGWVLAVGLAAGLGLLIRPSGMLYLGMWAGMVLLRDRRPRAVAAFALAAVPCVAFWLWSNSMKTGSPLSMGYQNGNPGLLVHYQMLRFGSRCSDSPSAMLDLARVLGESLVWRIAARPFDLVVCGFDFETRLDLETPFLPPAVLPLVLVGLVVKLARRDRRLASYLPEATLLAIFGAFVWGGIGFAWRYAGDFWPAVLAALLTAAHGTRRNLPAVAWLAGAGACLYLVSIQMTREILPEQSSIVTMDAAEVEASDAAQRQSDATPPPAVPSQLMCGTSPPSWLRSNGMGLAGSCEVSMVTNVYLGVPPKASPRYELRFKLDRPLGSTLPVYVNGKVYAAELRGHDDWYVADVGIDAGRLSTPVVMIAVEWSKSASPQAKLLEMDLI
jgi:hypothetical protein